LNQNGVGGVIIVFFICCIFNFEERSVVKSKLRFKKKTINLKKCYLRAKFYLKKEGTKMSFHTQDKAGWALLIKLA
jgi:hypothetical protein